MPGPRPGERPGCGRCGWRCSAAAGSARRCTGSSASRRPTWRRGSAPRWRWPGWRCAGPAGPAASTVDPALLTADAMELATRPDVDIVVEVIGGIEPARSLLLAAMKNGKSVVSANKALLAEDGATLHQAARDSGTDLYYEAAVGGAIPLLRPLRESLAGDAVQQVLGIVNGTTNYILDRMDTSGAGFSRRAGGGAGTRLRRARPDRRHRGLRRGSQGRDPGQPGVPQPGHRRRRATGKGSPGSPRPISPAPARSATWSSCSPSASAARLGCRSGCIRR